MIDGHFAYMDGVTEYESGWGSRPDGCVLAFTEEDLLALGSLVNGKLIWEDSNCFCKLDGNIQQVIITNEAKELIEQSKYKALWVDSPKRYLVKPV